MDDLFRAVSDVHRRRLLVALQDHCPEQDDIAVPKDVHEGEEDLDTLRVEFYHSHLPRLEAAGIIRWDQETLEVEKGPKFDEIRPLLELIGDDVDDLPDGWSSARPVSQPSD